MKNLFDELIKEFSEIFENLDGFDIKTEKTPDGFKCVAVKKQPEDNSELVKFVSDFKNYVQDIEDNIFEQACQVYSDNSDVSLTDLAKISDKADMKDKVLIETYCNFFKDCVKEVAQKYIETLKDKYEL